MAPGEMTREIVAASRSLAAVLDEESAALTEARFPRVAELLDAKESATVRYEETIRMAGVGADARTGITLAERSDLATAKADLDRAAARNVNALRAAMEMNRRLVQTIAASIDRQRVSASGYTKTGAAFDRSQAQSTGDILPVSLNRTL